MIIDADPKTARGFFASNVPLVFDEGHRVGEPLRRHDRITTDKNEV
jgi:hypothetical protein